MKIFPVILSSLIIITHTFAQEPVIGSRAGAMADAVIASSDNALSVYHNPAGIVALRSISSDITFGWEGFPLVENWSILYAKPQQQNTYYGFGFIRRHLSEVGQSYNSFQVLIPTTHIISDITAMGLNLKYLIQKSGSSEYHAKFSLDYGLRITYTSLMFALTARNLINPRMSSYPQQYAGGAAFKTDLFLFEADLFAADGEEFDSSGRGFRCGGEIYYGEYYAFRAGFQTYRQEEKITIGCGIYSVFKTNGVDYCYSAPQNNFAAGTHWLSYTYLAP